MFRNVKKERIFGQNIKKDRFPEETNKKESKENWFKPKQLGNSFSVQLALHSLTVHDRTETFFSGSFSLVATGGHYESSVREVNSKSLTWGK